MLIHHSVAGSLFSSSANPDDEEGQAYERLREQIKDEKFAIYREQVYASGGFDVDSISDSSVCDEIVPLLHVGEEADDELKVMADFAIAQHNIENGSNLELVKIIKANYAFASGVLYYITLDAKDDDKNTGTYQAEVFDGITQRRLVLFRPSSK
ncbi:uncharacterized protein LOC126678105 isoform X2 [Mercurialis annua]|uniref:uncharacterized protein LOC126678105 isoform X2 n=1 Tax=Mercurialis annua TaxID=3986 RepID=UPI00215F248F|nr:uncharacterized protein LOC126678105 isoform X2 [Mercurialis annua]